MIASLSMYDWPETMAYNDLFWRNLRAALLPICEQVPERLNRTDLHKQWQRNDVLVSQSCIYPLVTELPATTVVLGTPLYNAEHCSNGNYTSVLLVRQSDDRSALPAFADSTLAFNSQCSQSGFNALKSLLSEQQLITADKPTFFSQHVQSNSHRNSIRAVASGAADICAIDPVSWALAQRYDIDAKQVRVLMLTACAPALPMICSAAAIPATLNEDGWRNAFMGAFVSAIDDTAREHLLLDGIAYIPKCQYMHLPISDLDMITV